MTVLTAASDCGPFFFFIVFIVVIAQVVGAITKAAKQSGGQSGLGSLLDPDRLASLNNQLASGTAEPGLQSPRAEAPPDRYASKKPPVNWRVVRLNMTKEQINECFDMPALRKGIRKDELPNYVKLDKLRSYFSEPQLRDMLDMDFFDQKTEDSFHYQESLLTPLSPLSGQKAAPVKPEAPEPKAGPVSRKAKPLLQPALAPLDRETVAEFTQRESAFETSLVESVGESLNREKTVDAFSRDAVSESMFRGQTIAHYTPDVLTPAPAAAGMSDMQQAVIWKEILDRPPGIRAYRGLLSSMPPELPE